MKCIIGLLLFGLIMTFCISCQNTAEKTIPSSNMNYSIDKLFTHDGCTVYRFSDNGYKYFTNCKSVQWQQIEGKITVDHNNQTENELIEDAYKNNKASEE